MSVGMTCRSQPHSDRERKGFVRSRRLRTSGLGTAGEKPLNFAAATAQYSEFAGAHSRLVLVGEAHVHTG